jgi:hypothetical protein
MRRLIASLSALCVLGVVGCTHTAGICDCSPWAYGCGGCCGNVGGAPTMYGCCGVPTYPYQGTVTLVPVTVVPAPAGKPAEPIKAPKATDDKEPPKAEIQNDGPGGF